MENYGKIYNESPRINFSIKATCIVFRPTEGLELKGIVNKISDQHIGLLVYGLFNASIPHENLPNSYTYDNDTESWFNSKSSDSIKQGSEIKFNVVKINESNGMLSIIGKPILK